MSKNIRSTVTRAASARGIVVTEIRTTRAHDVARLVREAMAVTRPESRAEILRWIGVLAG